MDATAITKALNDHWLTLLDGYYDFIADSYLKHLSETHGIPIDQLEEKTRHLKKQILSDAHLAIESTNDIKKDARKTKPKVTPTTSNSSYDHMTHPELAKLCKERSLTVKRKKLDMINNLIQADGNKPKPAIDSSVSELPSTELTEEIIDEE